MLGPFVCKNHRKSPGTFLGMRDVETECQVLLTTVFLEPLPGASLISPLMVSLWLSDGILRFAEMSLVASNIRTKPRDGQMWLPGVGFPSESVLRAWAWSEPWSFHLPTSLAGEETSYAKIPSMSCTVKINFFFPQEAGELLLIRVS